MRKKTSHPWAWFFSIFMILEGFAANQVPLATFLLISGGIFISPYFSVWLEKKHKIHISTATKVIVALILQWFAGNAIPDALMWKTYREGMQAGQEAIANLTRGMG